MKDFKSCWKGLRQMMKPCRWQNAVTCLIGLLRIASSMGFVWICKALVDIATGASSMSFSTHIWIMVGIMLMQLITTTATSWWEGYVIVKVQTRQRAQIFSHVVRSEWSGRDTFHSGDTINRLEEDVRVVVDLITVRFPDAIITVFQLLAASTFLFILEPSLLWVLLILMPIAVLGSKLFFKKIRSLTRTIRDLDSKVQGHMQETLQHRILVRTLGCTEAVLDKMGWMQSDLVDNTVKRLNYNAVARGFMRAGFLAGYAAAFLWGVFGIKSGAVTFGMMTAFLQLVGQVQRPIADLSRHIPAFIHALTSVERLLELMELKLENEDSADILPGAPGVKVEGISFSYPDGSEKIFDNFSFDFKPGSITAIMGITGAGKSTLTRIILALLKPTSGKVSLYTGDKEIQCSAGTRRNFMYVPQGNSLMSGTIRENLLLANPSASDEQMKEALHIAVADFVLDLPMGLDSTCSEKGSGLSEGQAQRIAIARALLHEGGVLILDEATSALDSDTEKELLTRLGSRLDGTRTIIWITHREAITDIATGILKI